MQAIIYYFTGTHNTLMVCEKYQEEFAKKGVQCILHPVNQLANIPDPNKFDLVGFAYPIHGFNAPYIVYRFLRRLPKVKDKDYFIVKTSGEPVAMNNASSIHLVKKLKKKGFSRLTNEYHYVMPYNMIFRHTDEQAQKMWHTAQKLIPIDVKEILTGTHSLLKRPFLGGHCVVGIAYRASRNENKRNGLQGVQQVYSLHEVRQQLPRAKHNLRQGKGQVPFFQQVHHVCTLRILLPQGRNQNRRFERLACKRSVQF